MTSFVISPVSYCSESFQTVGEATSIRFESAVYSLVNNEISLLLETFVAVRFLAPVKFNVSDMLLLVVHVQSELPRKLSPALTLVQMRVLFRLFL